MALIVSAASGNFNAGATWVGGVVPTVGDEGRASTGHTISITANATCTEISNAGTGTFVLNSGVTLTANVTNKSVTTSINCLSFSAASPASASIQGNCTGGTVSSAIGANNTSTGTLNITGNVTSGSGSSSNGANNSGTGTLNITGNVAGLGATGAINSGTGTLSITGNVAAGSTGNVHGANNNSTGTLTITGNATGGSGAGGHGANNNSPGTLTITGNATGGSALSYGANNVTTGTLTITGIATGGTIASASGVNNASTGTVNLGRAKGTAYGPGNTSGLAAAVGASNAGLGVIEIQELEYGTFGMSPTSGTGIRLKKLGTNVAVFNYCDTAGAKTLIDATANAAMPAATDVRSGVSYASGAFTGSCAVPAASSVASGVPVDATTGTAVLTAAAIRTELATELGRIDAAISSRLEPSGTLARVTLTDTATTLTNAPTVPSVVQIRQEMDANSTKLANLDTTVSSRLAPSGTLATVTNLTNAPASVTPSDIWSHATRTLTTSSGPTAVEIRQELDSNSTKLANLDATVSSRLASSAYSAAPTTAQIATAVEGSLLNESDGQAVLNAIVGAIGNTNLSEVSLVAAVRADLERTGGKLDSIPTTAAPSASAVASATRTELSTELSRIDQAISSRLASSSYTAPANSDISAIKTKTDNLPASPAATGDIPSANITSIKTRLDSINVDRVNNTATTNIVGTLLAQSQS